MLPDGRTWRSAVGVVAAIGSAAALLGIVVYASVTRDIAFGIFTGDTGRAVVDDWYAGLLSNVGLVLWLLGAVASMTAAFSRARSEGHDTMFFVGMGAITAWLAADDAFLWHEEFVPNTLGIDENVVFGVYGLVGVAAVVVGRGAIVRNLWWVFASAGVLLAGSLVVERVGVSIGSPGATVSSLKFLGIATWTAFFVEAAVHRRRQNLSA